MKRRAKVSPQSRLHVVCPFCGVLCDKVTQLTWCAGCYVEYYQSRAGNIVFDDQRKTPRFAVAKAFMRAGGARIGKVSGE